jgi:BirA family biotin operon repressor/biotin-[acetyl-CoA-carboxylase] ligase
MVTGMKGDRARSALVGCRFCDVRWVDETGSTNRDLLDLAAGGAPEGVVLVADHQTAGRGRLDRAWQAPPGSSLLMSVLFRPTGPADDAHLLTTAVGVSAAEACRMVADVKVRLKWPNDLVVVARDDGAVRKVGGILAESIVEGSSLDAVVVGLGLNVNWPDPLPDEMAAELAGVASALNHVAGHLVDREELLLKLLQRLDHWSRMSPADLMARARDLSATLSSRVRVDLGPEQIVGTAAELTDAGSLRVELDDGSSREVVVGDVVHLRPAD